MDSPQYILSLIGALGGGMTLQELIKAIGRHRTGKAQSERVGNKNLLARARYAEALYQYERDFRIQVQDAASVWRRLALEHGVPSELIGPWPVPPEAPARPEEDPDTSMI